MPTTRKSKNSKIPSKNTNSNHWEIILTQLQNAHSYFKLRELTNFLQELQDDLKKTPQQFSDKLVSSMMQHLLTYSFNYNFPAPVIFFYTWCKAIKAMQRPLNIKANTLQEYLTALHYECRHKKRRLVRVLPIAS